MSAHFFFTVPKKMSPSRRLYTLLCTSLIALVFSQAPAWAEPVETKALPEAGQKNGTMPESEQKPEQKTAGNRTVAATPRHQGNQTQSAQGAAQTTSQNKTAQEAGWKTIDSGTKPAYAGIHGGTAPVTVLRASNGMLFVFTGQTGNDFTHVLRGNTANASDAPRAEAEAPAPEVEAAVAGQENATASPAAPALEENVSASGSQAAPPAAADITKQWSPPAHDAAQTVNLNSGLNSGPNAVQAAGPNSGPVEAAQAAGAGTPAPAQNAVAVQADAVKAPTAPETAASSEKPEGQAKTPPQAAESAPAKAVAASESSAPQTKREDTPPAPAAVSSSADTPTLIFASGDLVKEMAGSETIVPFGLPLPGESVGTPYLVPEPTLEKMPRLRLGDYRSILSHKGSL